MRNANFRLILFRRTGSPELIIVQGVMLPEQLLQRMPISIWYFWGEKGAKEEGVGFNDCAQRNLPQYGASAVKEI